MEFNCSDLSLWKEALLSYEARIEALDKPNLVSLDGFYRNELPVLIRQRDPTPYIITSELTKLMQWKLTRGKWRPRLLDFVSSLDDEVVKSASQAGFRSLPDVSKAISELTVLKGVGPATASAVLAAYAPDVAPFMSDEELTAKGLTFTPSDIERALWSSAIGAKLSGSTKKRGGETGSKSKRKRNR
ncbi:unnamed protein product [Cuscuta epithymum]|uniref:Uncharacterized protein n=1 Tax=Cuscuta epithymum TaxID=186058 RepID=A0AAV0ECB2_9ASTE|nr:unnamed protein product [Cuscuta epithymum]